MKSQNCPLGGGAEKLTDMLSLQNWRVYIPASAKANSWTEMEQAQDWVMQRIS